MIVIGIYITREKIYGLKTETTDATDDLRFRVDLAEQVMSNALITEMVDVGSIKGESIRRIVALLMKDGVAPDKISIACYGPFSSLNVLDDPSLRKVNNEHPMIYGQISIDAPDVPFVGFNLDTLFKTEFGKYGVTERIIFQTDVAASGLAEWSFRGGVTAICQNRDYPIPHENLVLLSFRQGVGGAMIDRDGRILNGFLHPEMGHISLEMHPSDMHSSANPNGFQSHCTHHKNCVEGLASEAAFFRRFDYNPDSFEEVATDTGNVAWDVHAFYIAQLCAATTHLFAPTMIVLEGKVFQESGFLKLVRKHFLKRLGGISDKAYSWYPLIERDDGFLQRPMLAEPGLVGAACIPAMPQKDGNIVPLEDANA